MRRLLAILFLSLWVVTSSWADTKSDIAYQYHRSTEATKLKYLDGIYCIRAPNFQLISREGLRLNLVVERQRMKQFISTALRVDEKVDILSCQQTEAKRAVCRVRYTTLLVTVDPLTDKELTETLTTGCTDEWSLMPQGWRLVSTRVTEQEFKR